MRPRNPICRGLLAVVTAAAVLGGATACVGGRSADGRSHDVAEEADTRYGPAPRPHRDVTYQPDVVLVGGGSRSVRSVTADGLTWRIDPRAEGADTLARGKVMFITGRGVGRVLDVRPDGDDLAVTIGPVAITEVIRDGRFTSDRPIAFDRMVANPAGEPFWAETEESGPGTGGSGGGRLPGRSKSARIPAGQFNVTPTCCATGIGLHFTYDSGGIRLVGTLELMFEKPSGTFDLVIDNGSIRTAKFEVTGGTGLRLDVEGGSALGAGHNINRRITVPVDFSVPLGTFLGVPFSATVNQSLTIQTAFSAKNGNIQAKARYAFGGKLGFGYQDGSFDAWKPTGFQVKNSLTNSITGISVGVNGLLFAYQARLHVGIGAFGFSTGLYVGLTASVGVTIGSALGAPITVCRGATLTLFTDYGVGYRLPTVVVKVINIFLRVFEAKPIEAEGGIGGTTNVLNRNEVVPDVPLCRK
ncbi:hypothetical protein GCM10027280_41050 [Micromonospora polyrhachis]|uniref:Lipoprotein n=1 Tax=Micromonospora polyrhachis TaxID=1282883 RepID=A0A7W7SL55_9ACTN|nr:hypothetical protein [Micromonospora polyrhachis]MBB4956804.1 hypothetical protein [Micromonospora polyrhachis]